MANGNGKRRSKDDWLALKREFIGINLDGEVMSLKDFAEKKKIAWGTVRNKAAEANWLHDLEERLDLKHTKEVGEVKKAHERAIARLRSMAINEETSVRSRHAAHGRNLQGKAHKRFEKLTDEDIETMHVRDALSMMRLGLEIEHRALGLLDKLEPGNPITNPHDEMDKVGRTSLNTEDVDGILVDVLESLLRRGSARDPSLGEDAEPNPTF